MVEEASKSTLHGISNILNASSDLASALYRQPIIQQENGVALRRRTRKTQSFQRDVFMVNAISPIPLAVFLWYYYHQQDHNHCFKDIIQPVTQTYD